MFNNSQPTNIKHIISVIRNTSTLWTYLTLILFLYRLNSVIISLLASSTIDRGFNPKSGQTNTLNLVIAASAVNDVLYHII
jgi:hypothetical protein